VSCPPRRRAQSLRQGSSMKHGRQTCIINNSARSQAGIQSSRHPDTHEPSQAAELSQHGRLPNLHAHAHVPNFDIRTRHVDIMIIQYRDGPTAAPRTIYIQHGCFTSVYLRSTSYLEETFTCIMQFCIVHMGIGPLMSGSCGRQGKGRTPHVTQINTRIYTIGPVAKGRQIYKVTLHSPFKLRHIAHTRSSIKYTCRLAY
jgi:hypothetical protein